MPRLSPGEHVIDVVHDGLIREALLFVPPHAEDGLPRPVVIVLHGTGGSGAWTRDETRWNDLAARAGFHVVYPDGRPLNPARPIRFLTNPRRWNDGSQHPGHHAPMADDVGFLTRLLDHLPGRLVVDESRIYVTGFSNGAGMTFRLAAALHRRLAAIGPVSGLCWVDPGRLPRPVPTLYLIGDADPLIPLDGGSVRLPWGGHEPRPPVRESWQRWARACRCHLEPRTIEQTSIRQVLRYEAGEGGVPFTCQVIHGLGHHWPGGLGRLDPRWGGPVHHHVDACAVLWDFFQSHQL